MHAQQVNTDLSNTFLTLVMYKNSNGIVPIRFEENDSTSMILKNGDTTRFEYYSKYTDRRTILGKGFRKTTISRDKIRIWQNDSLNVEVKRQDEKASGIIGGIKGSVKRKLIPSVHNNISPAEHYYLVDDSLNFILFQPELGIIELESSPTYQSRRLIGKIYNELRESKSGSLDFTRLNRQLNTGDKLQLLFLMERFDSIAKNSIEIPVQLLTFSVSGIKSDAEGNQVYFKTVNHDLTYNTEFDYESGVIDMYPEGFAINQEIFVKDSLYPKTIAITPANAPPSPHPFNPNYDISGPRIDAFYDRLVSIGDTTINITSYWNFEDKSIVNFIPEFPFPWVEQPEDLRIIPTYLKYGDLIYGNEYSIPENLNYHFSSVRIDRDTLLIGIYSPEKNNISIEFQNSVGKTIQKLKQSHGVRAGFTELKFAKPSFSLEQDVYLVLITKEKGNITVHQRFRYIQNN